MKFNQSTMTAFTIMFFLTIVSISRIGQVPSAEPLEWWTPIWVLMSMLIPFILGYIGGKE